MTIRYDGNDHGKFKDQKDVDQDEIREIQRQREEQRRREDQERQERHNRE